MSLQFGENWIHQKYKFQGLSLSGIRTAIAMPELSLCFDVAQGFPFLINLKHFFISHGHLDHAAGVPYIISQRAMNSLAPGKFYMPPSLVGPLTEIMRLWEKIEKHEYHFEFIPVKPDDEIQINNQTYVKVFPTTHRIDSCGYTVFETHKKLRAEYTGCHREEIIELKTRGVEINEIHHTPAVSFTGDTQIEFLDSRDWIKKSKVLILEATYLDDRKTIEQARQWGHTHLQEIIPRLEEIESEKIVFIHASSRYSDKEAVQLLRQQIPEKFHSRIVLYPGR